MSRHIDCWWLIICLDLVLFGGCNPQTGPAVLTQADNGKTIAIQVGDLFTIQLEGNPTTGYSWEPENDALVTIEKVGEVEFSTPAKNLVGAAGIMTLKFKAVKAGQETLELVYHRPWEKGVAPLKTFAVTVIAR